MMRCALVAVGLLLVACAARRHLDLEFTATNSAQLASVASVQVEVFDGSKCVCGDLDKKDGCMTATDEISRLTFSPSTADRDAGGFPDGSLVVRVSAVNADASSVALRVNCWCVPDASTRTLVFPISETPVAQPGSAGCGAMTP